MKPKLLPFDAKVAYKEILAELKDAGLRFSDCVEAFGEARDESAYGRLAFDKWHKEGDIEIDETTVVSDSSQGAYVMAWVWVDKFDDEDEDDN